MICKTFMEPVHGAIDGELHIRHELIEDCHAAINNLPWKVGSYPARSAQLTKTNL